MLATLGFTKYQFSASRNINVTLSDTEFILIGDDSSAAWNFIETNILPGDSGAREVVIKNNRDTSGYLNITFDNLVNSEMGCTEPEKNDDSSCDNPGENQGELAENLDILIYIDENSNDNFDLGTDTLVYRGKTRGILQGDLFNYPLAIKEEKTFRVEWDLPMAIGNIVQIDKAGFDIVFELTDLKKEIIADWHFNENSGDSAYDSSGQNNDGAINGAVWAGGKYNSALSFDGVDDYVEIADSESFQTISNEITIETWVKVNSNKNYNSIVVKDIDGKEDFELLCNSGGDCYSTFDGAFSRFYKLVDVNLQPGEWTYLAITYKNGGDWIFYKNGTEINTTSGTQSLKITSEATLKIGDENGTAGRQFDGLIDEVKVYNYALTEEEIINNYQKGN